MKVVYTDEAIENLVGILSYTASHYPTVYDALLVRLRTVIARIGQWPDSAAEVVGRPGVRVVPLIRYPFKVFYRITGEAIENSVHPSCRPGRQLIHGSRLTPKRKARRTARFRQTSILQRKSGAGEGARTLDPDLGKVVLYH
jgi:toxin ParE1/3/4